MSWRDQAACLGITGERLADFYPEETDAGEVELSRPKYEAKAKRAKTVCATCPVQDSCLAAALENREPAGIWGGMTFRERETARTSARMQRQSLNAGTAGTT